MQKWAGSDSLGGDLLSAYAEGLFVSKQWR